MKKFLLFSIVVLLFIPFAFSQSGQQYFPSTGVRAAYLGSIAYPGLKLGIERPYKLTQIDKVRKKSTKTLYRERYLVYSFGMYYHTTVHTNFFLQTEWLMRKQKSSGMFYEFAPGLGLSRTFLDGATYRFDDDGNAIKVPLAGNFYGLVSLSAGIGYNFNIKLEKPFKIYLKPSLLVMFPYNKTLYPRPTVELGLVYNLDGFWQSNPKYFQKLKDKTKNK